MMQLKRNKRGQDCRKAEKWFFGAMLCLVLVALLTTPAFAEDVGGIVLPDYRHIDLTMAHGAGTQYVKFDGGGQNALHITMSTAEPYGQVTTNEEPKGTFYLSDTGGRGFFDDTILMVAVKGDVPDNFQIKIKASGYRWTPTPILNKGPTADEVKHIQSSVSDTFTKQDLIYGPQSWKPCNAPDYPIYYGQDMNDPAETFRFMYIDLKAGLLGPNSNLTGLVDQGMVKIEYEIENPGEFTVFNAYGWCNQSNQGKGISWTNDVAGESNVGASGFSVRSKSQSPGGDVPAGTGSGGTGSVSFEEGATESTVQEEDHSLSQFVSGQVNGSVVVEASSDPPASISAGEHANFTLNLPMLPGSKIEIARLYAYSSEGYDHAKGNRTLPDLSFALDGLRLKNDTRYQDVLMNGTIAGTYCINLTGVLKDPGRHAITVTNNGTTRNTCLVEGVQIVAVRSEPDGKPVTYWIEEGCDAVQAALPGSMSGEENSTLASFEGVLLTNKSGSTLTIVSTGNSTRRVTLNSHEWEIPAPVNLTAGTVSLDVSPYLVEGLNSAGISIGSSGTGHDSLVNRNAILVVPENPSETATSQANISVRHIQGNNTAGVPAQAEPTTPAPAATPSRVTTLPTRIATVTPDLLPEPGPFGTIEEFFWSLFDIFSIFEEGNGSAAPATLPAPVETGIPPGSNKSTKQSSPPVEVPTNFTLTLITDPPGAKVVFDGSPAGSPAPLTVNDVQQGLHRVALQLDGYESLETVIDVEGDEEVTVALVPAIIPGTAKGSGTAPMARSGMGGIYVNSVPSGADILIDGRSTGATTPFIIPSIREGSHRVTLRKEKVDFPGGGSQVYVYSDVISKSFITQEVVPSRTLSIDSETFKGDEFSINGRFPKYRVPAKVSVEGSSAYVTILHKGEFLTFPVSDYLNNGDVLSLLPANSSLASVDIRSVPEGADIMIDGFPTGLLTPAVVGNVSNGRHRMLISKRGYIPEETEFSVIDDQTRVIDATVELRLGPYEYGSLTAKSTPANAKIYLSGRDTQVKTPYTFSYLGIGSYTLRVVGEKDDKNFDIVITPGNELLYDIDFQTGKVLEKSVPLGRT